MQRSRTTGLILGVVIVIISCLLPAPPPLTAVGMRTLGVFLCTLIWWLTVGVTYPSLLSLGLLIITGVMPAERAFAVSFGSWIVVFLLGCFGLCEALRSTGATKRLALWFLSRPVARRSPWMLLTLFFLACTAMGSVMSVTITTMVFMGIGSSMLAAVGYRRGDFFSALLMMGVAWTATASHAMTPVAHVTNLLMMEWVGRDFGYTLTFLQWMTIGVPTGIAACLFIVAFFRYVIRPDIERLGDAMRGYVREEVAALGRMRRGEKVATAVFAAVVVCWMLPDLIGGRLPEMAQYLRGLGYATPALLGACFLCVAREEDGPILSFGQWMVDGVDWGSMMLVVAVLGLGDALSSPEAGIIEAITGVFGPVAVTLPPMMVVVLAVLWAVTQTNVMSNLVSMTVVYSIVGPLAATAGIENPVALGVTIAASCSYAFSLPPATTATALVVGSGWVPTKVLLRYGLLMIPPTVLWFAAVFYPLATLLFR